MSKRVRLICFALLAVTTMLAVLAVLPAGTVQALVGESLFRWLPGVGSGGGMASGAGYTLSDSIGQGITGSSAGGNYRLEAGYQAGLQESTRWQVFLPMTSK